MTSGCVLIGLEWKYRIEALEENQSITAEAVKKKSALEIESNEKLSTK